jgi:hypothetical protein
MRKGRLTIKYAHIGAGAKMAFAVSIHFQASIEKLNIMGNIHRRHTYVSNHLPKHVRISGVGQLVDYFDYPCPES